MSKLSSLLLGAVTGAAAALFVQSKKGQEVAKQAKDWYADYQADPEATKEKVSQAANEFSQNVAQRYDEFKEGVQSGDITVQSVMDDVKAFSEKQVETLTEKFGTKEEVVSKVKKAVTPDEEIIIDMDVEVEEEKPQPELKTLPKVSAVPPGYYDKKDVEEETEDTADKKEE
ncbi:YtxH domain-containing protein [Streptococcus danieliae]|uniref:YtxH domain-containing protein n=1 Tax=Streptococcus danieliae TaxID=747656 RepID=A0A7Z0LE28_9STRE|nr:YtxH domain-containing protein [Streptococcus danieliae]MBF0717720.1 YtxH domain-containing protein [Streptococcus danieliae]NYS49650.1 YtxH domain-containing protein [Streptococcus danieliae]